MTKPMPLFPSEDEIAKAVMGDRAAAWPDKARYFENKHNMPKIDEVMGARFWPAVEDFFKRRAGLDARTPADGTIGGTSVRIVPFPADTKEPPRGAQTESGHHRRPERRPRRARA